MRLSAETIVSICYALMGVCVLAYLFWEYAEVRLRGERRKRLLSQIYYLLICIAFFIAWLLLRS